jgi:hypothetical protein
LDFKCNHTHITALNIYDDGDIPQVEAMSTLLGQLAGDVRSLQGRVDGLGGQVASLALETRILSATSAQQGGGGGSGVGVELLAALEKRLGDRQSRFESALMQVCIWGRGSHVYDKISCICAETSELFRC